MNVIFVLVGFFIGFLLTRSVFGGIGGIFSALLFKTLYFDKKFHNKVAKPTKIYSPADFELNLLSLCALVIRADGAGSRQELDYVRHKFVSLYGKEKANHIFRTFSQINRENISLERVSLYVRVRTQYETRLEIIHFLFQVADIDGSVREAELQRIQRIAYQFSIFPSDFESIKAMFYKTADDDYKILGILPTATDAEVKKAYRDMAKKYHPDRVVTEDEAIRKGAEEKFKKVQRAYENIMKDREKL